MEYPDWSPTYRRIAEEFGFPFDREVRSADRLEALLPPSAREPPLPRVARRLAGREVVIVGTAPGAGPPPIWRLADRATGTAVVAADGATAACLGAGIVPDVVVTDLDGDLPAEVVANRRGSLVVVHAHGDNRPALEEWVPQFPGEVAGSWAGPPRPALLDVGGFTDGDRGVYLAEHVGARRLVLWGLDFDHVAETDPSRAQRALIKLAWARRSIDRLVEQRPTPVELWQRDGSFRPYPPGKNVASTR